LGIKENQIKPKKKIRRVFRKEEECTCYSSAEQIFLRSSRDQFTALALQAT
jgi:hypothetical protein